MPYCIQVSFLLRFLFTFSCEEHKLERQNKKKTQLASNSFGGDVSTETERLAKLSSEDRKKTLQEIRGATEKKTREREAASIQVPKAIESMTEDELETEEKKIKAEVETMTIRLKLVRHRLHDFEERRNKKSKKRKEKRRSQEEERKHKKRRRERSEVSESSDSSPLEDVR